MKKLLFSLVGIVALLLLAAWPALAETPQRGGA